MKKIAYILFSLMLLANFAYSQGEVEALNYSRNGIYGTARSMSMGGAFGALGGDMTGVSINPAGIGVYRSSEIAGTLGFASNTMSVGNISKKVNESNMHTFGFVGYFPMRSEVIPAVNFGFSYNRQKSFQNQISGVGSSKSTLIDYIADRGYGINYDRLKMGKDLPDPFLNPYWLPVLGYNSWLIEPHQNNDGKYYYTPLIPNTELVKNEIITSESGYKDYYDFTIGTTINNVLNLGMALNVAEVRHNSKTEYYEDFKKGEYNLINEVWTRGAGVGAKVGIIYRPTQAFRLGLAYHSPTWFSMSEEYKAEMNDNVGQYVNNPEYKAARTNSALFTNSYNLRTPDKWVMSAAAVLGNSFILSADYELTNYKNMKLSVPENPQVSKEQQEIDAHWYDNDNYYIKKDMKAASTFKLGMEYRFTQQLSARLGYAWMQNPYETEFKNAGDAAISSSRTIYRVEGDTHYYTGGFGYRFNRSFYLDLAVVYKTQQDDLYPFPNLYSYNGEVRGTQEIFASPMALKSTSLRGLVTLGYRF